MNLYITLGSHEKDDDMYIYTSKPTTVKTSWGYSFSTPNMEVVFNTANDHIFMEDRIKKEGTKTKAGWILKLNS